MNANNTPPGDNMTFTISSISFSSNEPCAFEVSCFKDEDSPFITIGSFSTEAEAIAAAIAAS